MNGIRVGKRIIGADSPVTIGWENIPRVEGGPAKQFIFTWFQPAMLLALLAFWYYAPNSIAKASTAIGIGIGFKVLLLGLEWVNPRYRSWQLTWKELTTDLFYVGLGYTILRIVDSYIGSDVMAKGIQHVPLGQVHVVRRAAPAGAGVPDLVSVRFRAILDASRDA
jgi:hypothetical protein